MRLPRRPLDPALKDAVPSSPSSNRVHPEVSPHAGSPAVVTPKPRRLPPLSGSPGAALTPERGPGPEPRSNLEPGSHRADTALSPGAASELQQRRIRGHVYEELRGAFQLFDLDGDGMIDEFELYEATRVLARHGRIREPTRAQVKGMLAEADIDDDGEVDFDEFVQMVLQCDLHPTMCRRCQDSQFVTFEDAWFGESRLDRDKSTCRQRMVARDEKAIHLSLAMVAYGSVVQTLLLVLGALLWWGSSHDELAQTADALAVAIVSIVMASFAVTIGCAGRPVNRWAFVVFAVWQVVAGVMVVLLMLDITNGEGACELSLENGLAPTSTSLACPQLVQGLQAVAPARERCESSIANGRCQWADMCTSRSPERCEKTKRPGLCIYVSDGCRTTDNHSVANIGDVHGVCAPTGQCRFASAVWIAGVVFLCVAGLSLLAVVNVLNNSRYPLRISLATRYSRSVWSTAMQLALDPQITREHVNFKKTGEIWEP